MSMTQDQIEELRRYADEYDPNINDISGRAAEWTERVLRDAADTIERLSAELAAINLNDGWIPVKFREITDEDRQKKNYPEEAEEILDCPLPDDGEEILITTLQGRVEMDTHCIDDDCCYLGEHGDWDEALAWRRMPESYEPKEDKR